MRIFFLIFLFIFPSLSWSDSELTVGGKTAQAHIIESSGTDFRPRPFLNFIGATVQDANGKTNVSFSGGGSGGVTTGIPGQVAVYTSTTQVGSSGILTDTSVNIGIGTTAPATKLDVEGDLYLHTTPSHIYWTSANGNCWVETVDNNGNTNIDSTTCPMPPNPINNNLTYLGNNLTYLGSQLTY